MSSPGRKAGAPPLEPPAGEYFLQATAECRLPEDYATIFWAFFSSAGKDKAGRKHVRQYRLSDWRRADDSQEQAS